MKKLTNSRALENGFRRYNGIGRATGNYLFAFEFLATLGKLRRKCSVSRLPRRGREKFSARKVFVALMPDK
jgi:hypothetical protein